MWNALDRVRIPTNIATLDAMQWQGWTLFAFQLHLDHLLYCWNASEMTLENRINVPSGGEPKGEDWNVSSVNTIQVPIKKTIGMCWYSMLLQRQVKMKGRVYRNSISGVTYPYQGLLIDITSRHS